jgi:multicomponent Na+:H+ antiporter subunit B
MKKPLIAITLAAGAVPMLIGVAALPRPGDASAPAHTHVAARYIEAGARETGADNRVTAVLLNYRALDTFGEVLVIFAALAGVVAVRSPAAPGGQVDDAPGIGPGVPISPVVAFIIRLTAPFIALFGAFVIFEGHVSPGGGFQGGVILGALLVLLSLVLGRDAGRPLVPVALVRWLQAAAPLTFACVGLLGLAQTGALLGYPAEPERQALRELMMITLDVGIGIGGAMIILGLFLELRGD